MKYIKCIKDTALLTAGTWYGISELNFYGSIVTVFRPLDNDWVMSDKENFDRGFLSDNNPDFKMKEFQNEQHKQLHNALIGAGFTDCGGENLPKSPVSWNYGYINKQLDEFIYFDYCTDECILIRNISDNNKTAFYGAPVADIITHYESLAQTQPITKENIAEVLKFNNITDISVHTNSLGKKHCFSLSMKPDNWLEPLEAITGKLKPLPKLEEIELKVGDLVESKNLCPTTIKSFDYVNEKIYFHDYMYVSFRSINNGIIESVNGKSGIYKIPEFNFERYLLDNGFNTGICNGSVFYLWKNDLTIERRIEGLSQYMFCDKAIALTPQNADIIIAMAKLAEDLK